MIYNTTVRVWQADENVEGIFEPLAATWIFRFDAPAFAEPLSDGAISTLYGDMRVEGMRFYIDAVHAGIGYRWLVKDKGTGLFYLVEPASPRVYPTGLRHIEANARRLNLGPIGL